MQIKGSYKIDVIDDVSGEKIHSYTQNNKVFVDRFNNNLKLMKVLSNTYAQKKLSEHNVEFNRNTNNITIMQNIQFLHAMIHNMVTGEYALFYVNDSQILQEQPDFVIDGSFRLYDLWQPTTVIDNGDVIGISHIDKETPIFTKHDETRGKSIKFNINTPIVKTSISNRTVSIPNLRQKRISYDVEYTYAYNSNVSETKETEKLYSIGLVPSMKYRTSQGPQNLNSDNEFSGYFSNINFYLDKVFGVDYGVTKLQQLYNPNNVTNLSQGNNPVRDMFYNSLVIDNLITYSELDVPQTVNYSNEDGTKSTKTFVITYKLQFLFDVPETTDTYKENYLNSLYNQAFANERKQIEISSQPESNTQQTFLPLMLSYHTYLKCYEYSKQTKDDCLKIINEMNIFLRKDRLLQVLDDLMTANLANDEFKSVDRVYSETSYIINQYLDVNYQLLTNKNTFTFINGGYAGMGGNNVLLNTNSHFGKHNTTNSINFDKLNQNRYSLIPLYKFADVAEVNDFISEVTFNNFERTQKNMEYSAIFTNLQAFYGKCVYKGKVIPFIFYNHSHLNNIYLSSNSWQYLITNMQPETQEFNTIINGYTINSLVYTSYTDFYNLIFGNSLRYSINFHETPIKIKNDDGEYLGMIKNASEIYENTLTLGI